MSVKYVLLNLYIFFLTEFSSCSIYRNWTSTAKSNFKKGKDTYKLILNNLQEKESDCMSLLSNDKNVTDNFPIDLDYIHNTTDPYPCLTQFNRIGDKFDIDDDGVPLDDTSYTKIMNEAGCWKYVLGEINTLDVDSCDFKGDASRSLIALAKTKCHFLRANRKFPTKEQGCILNPSKFTPDQLNTYLSNNTEYRTNPCKEDYKSNECEKLKRRIVSHCTDPSVMSESAFQMYHSDLNHIDNICFYLQAGDWNQRTETNINKLADSANHMINVYNNVKDQFEILNSKQNEQLNKAENLTMWIDNIKSDLGDVLRIITTVKEYQRRILEFINNFKTYCTYIIFVILGIIATSFEFAANSRWKVLTCIGISCMLETLTHKVFNGWLDLEINDYFSPETQDYILKFIRMIMASYIILEWLYAFIWYKPGWKITLNEVNELKKVIENPIIYIPNNSLSNMKEIKYTLDEFVDKFGDNSDDSDYTYESESLTSSEYLSEDELGSGSDYLVDDYTDSRRSRNKKKSYFIRKSRMFHY
ncbi:putative integral membrane protein [Theileria parva strain Muguga]|uniref:putative integral membrane protein n=1 Tax=Theileria parva strain Muguga TaxID=333668 RepID=UPI001C617977|nr:putative integral membrane protein [Theileria parva strain Muguga]EAN33736.2 putative integral membrane protein [Theileria parva strain Muguga]